LLIYFLYSDGVSLGNEILQLGHKLAQGENLQAAVGLLTYFNGYVRQKTYEKPKIITQIVNKYNFILDYLDRKCV